MNLFEHIAENHNFILVLLFYMAHREQEKLL